MFGAERVGMVTGDASINADAPIICCTAEILANMALRRGADCGADCVVMDEFHYYSDRDRGWAWLVPLITLEHTQFLLMSATLGDVDGIASRLESYTGRPVAHVQSHERPVPLSFEWKETPIHETIDTLVSGGCAPVYVVQFTQRECAELAQALTSINAASSDEKQAIRDEIGAFRFDSPYGRDMRRFLQAGIGLHHAGLLPKYRLLVERLAQKGLLKVIVGTDTLGVGINVPIRSVLFAKLCKFDGEKVRVLSVRDFRQIAGRAGRRGYDTRGYVLAQAPAHVIENQRAAAKAAAKGKKKFVRSKAPTRGYVHYDSATFERLQSDPAEALEPRFEVNHAIVLQLLQRDGADSASALETLDAIIERTPLREVHKEQARSQARTIVETLLTAGIVEGEGDALTVSGELQDDFSLFESLSLYLVDALGELNQTDENYALDVISLVEAIQENPTAVLIRQVDVAKRDIINRLKAEGVEYEERIQAIEDVTYPKPNGERIYASFNAFCEVHPWLTGANIRPKSVAREMYEGLFGFGEYVREYQLSRSEGVLLRYLSQVWRTLRRTIPEGFQSEELVDAIAWLRALLAGVDSSLITEWERLQTPVDDAAAEVETPWWTDRRAVRARLRGELLNYTRAVSIGDYEAAESYVAEGSEPGSAGDIETALAPYYEDWERLIFDHRSRLSEYLTIEQLGPQTWQVRQTLRDPEESGEWYITGVAELSTIEEPSAPVVRITHLGR